MRRVAERIGIRAPSLYKHVPDKAELEVRLVAQGLAEVAAALAAARSGPRAARRRLSRVGRRPRPALRARDGEPLPRDRLPPGLEAAAADPLLSAFGDEHVAARRGRRRTASSRSSWPAASARRRPRCRVGGHGRRVRPVRPQSRDEQAQRGPLRIAEEAIRTSSRLATFAWIEYSAPRSRHSMLAGEQEAPQEAGGSGRCARAGGHPVAAAGRPPGPRGTRR